MLTALQTLSLSKAVDEKVAKAARASVVAGAFEVDFTVRVVGTVRVGEDTTVAATTSIPWSKVAALLLQRAGCTRDGSVALLRSVLTEALAGEDDLDKALTEEAKAMVADLVGDLPRQARKGAVTMKVAVLPVEVEEPAVEGLQAVAK